MPGDDRRDDRGAPKRRARGKAARSAPAQENVQLVAFRLLDGRYGLELATVERVLPMVAVSPLPGAPAAVLGAVNLQGRAVPVVDLRVRFGLAARAPEVSDHLLVARTAKRTVALPVDEALGVMDVAATAVADPDEVAPGVELLSGVAALADGLLYIHDLDALLSLDEERQLDDALGTAAT